MIAIFKREFKSYLHTFIGSLAVAAILMVFFVYFLFNNILGQSPLINNPLYATALVAITFALPILCMRTFSEERRSKSDQLILTAPVSIGGIVFGKFLALAAVFAIPSVLFCLLPVVLSRFGTIQYLWNYTSVLGFFLYGLMAIAICMFVSSLSENPIVSAVISMVVLLVGSLLTGIFDRIPSEPVKTFLKSTFDFSMRLEAMMNGTLDWTSVIYFLTVTALFLFLCTQAIQKRRYTISRNNLSISGYSLGMTIVLIAAVVFANLAATQIPERIRNVDVTKDGLYSISAQSREVAAGLQDDIVLYYLASDKKDDTNRDANVNSMLEEYAAASDHITLKYVDPAVNPSFYKSYADSALTYNSVIVENQANQRSKALDYYNLVQMSYDDYSFSSSISGYDVEGQVTSALQNVTRSEEEMKKAYFLSGHNEVAMDDTFQDLFSRYNLATSDLNIKTSEGIPEDCQVLIINAPGQDLSEDDVAKITAYLDKGGNIMINTLYLGDGNEMPNLNKVFGYYGVSLETGIVVETDPGMYYYSAQAAAPYYLFPRIGAGDVTQELSDNGSMVFAPVAEALTYSDETEGMNYTPLLTTSEGAYLKKAATNGSDLSQSDSDPVGPFTLGLHVFKSADTESSTAMFFTSSEMFTTDADTMVNGGNAKLMGAAIKTLAGVDSSLVNIPVKQLSTYLVVNGKDALAMASVGICLILLVLAGGLIIWLMRRKA